MSPRFESALSSGCSVAPALDLEHRPVRRRGAVERQQPADALGRRRQLLRGAAHREDRLRVDVDAARPARARSPSSTAGQGALAEVAVAVERHHQQPVGHLGRRPGHHRPEGAEQHRRRAVRVGPGHERRRHQRVPGVLAPEVERGPVLPRVQDRLHREHDLAHPRGRRRPGGAVPLLDVWPDLRARARAGSGRRLISCRSHAAWARCIGLRGIAIATLVIRSASTRPAAAPPAAGRRRADPRR